MPEIHTSAGHFSYTLKRSRRRTIALRVSPDGSVTVSAPRFALGLFIERFVRQQSDWVLAQLRRFTEHTQKYPRPQFRAGELFWHEGQKISLEILLTPHLKQATAAFETAKAVVRTSEENPSAISQALKQAYWSLTETRVNEAICHFAPLFPVTPRSIKVANQKARWGSCSARGDLRFNWRLSMMPPAVLEGIVVHELAHIHVHNHSSHFWERVASVLPDYKERKKWLKQNGRALTF